MSIIVKGLGSNVLTKGFGSFIRRRFREVLRLVSRISTALNIRSRVN